MSKFLKITILFTFSVVFGTVYSTLCACVLGALAFRNRLPGLTESIYQTYIIPGYHLFCILSLAILT
ncbi:MAG: hypothetical protein LBR75_03175, partial [Prevotellaceae bacterium]|nr:hypothetical protein [Prevotellaceae bacterium]